MVLFFYLNFAFWNLTFWILCSLLKKDRVKFTTSSPQFTCFKPPVATPWESLHTHKCSFVFRSNSLQFLQTWKHQRSPLSASLAVGWAGTSGSAGGSPPPRPTTGGANRKKKGAPDSGNPLFDNPLNFHLIKINQLFFLKRICKIFLDKKWQFAGHPWEFWPNKLLED